MDVEHGTDATRGGGDLAALRGMRLVAAPLVAANFLTVVPIPVPASVAVGPMGPAVACFPLAGAALGVLLAAVDVVLGSRLPPPVVAALLLATSLAITGALHLDGLMDSFDGLFGGRDPERRLAIMRDSRVGSFGIAAAAAVLLVEYGSLVSLPAGGRGAALILAATLSRWAMVVLLSAFPAASSSGLAAGLKPQLGRRHLAAATLLAVGLAAIAAGPAGVAMALVAGALALLGGRLATARLGGITGDNCGGMGQLVEAATLVGCVALGSGL